MLKHSSKSSRTGSTALQTSCDLVTVRELRLAAFNVEFKQGSINARHVPDLHLIFHQSHIGAEFTFPL